MEKPLILVTNDDGTFAPGIRALVQQMRSLGKVVVVAPDKPQSGMGHAITINSPLFLKPASDFSDFEDVEAWACSGTPVDCVKLACDKVLDRKPDLCVSGINHGSNASINVIYSGTMSAAMEAAMEGIPAIGFSLLDYRMEADFTAAAAYAFKIAAQTLNHGLPAGDLLNVNIPNLPLKEIKGMKVCRQANAKWVEEFVERETPHGKKYYWLTGRFENQDKSEEADETALAAGYVSIVPVQFDLTDHKAVTTIRGSWDLSAPKQNA